MSDWISVKDKLPEHDRLVLVYAVTGAQVVCIFLYNKKTMDSLCDRGMIVSDKEDKNYFFCSQENPGNCLNGVTHWCPLPKAP